MRRGAAAQGGYLDGTLIDTLQQRIKQALRRNERLKPEEAAVLAILRQRLAKEAKRKAKAVA